MSRVSDKMLIELIERRNLPPDDPQCINTAMFKAFLDGHFVLRPGIELVDESRILDTSNLVELMIQAGYHKVTNKGKGMKASAYRKLWPSTVIQPLEYVGRFDKILLVDKTITLRKLTCYTRILTDDPVDPKDCTDTVPAPCDNNGKPLSRYIAFVQLGEKSLNQKTKECQQGFALDEVGLVTVEGLHLPMEYAEYFSLYTVNIVGSSFVDKESGEMDFPSIGFLPGPIVENPRALWGLQFLACSLCDPEPEAGSASRGVKVIPVT